MSLELKGKRSVGFTFAWNGLKEVTRTERNFRIHLFITALVLTIGFLVELNWLEWCIVIFAIGFVLVTEVTNSAIEKMIDYLNPAIHPSAKIIKDMAAGAVLIAAIIAALIGLIIFLPKIYTLFM
ncbi:diacylglycerol kinase [Virgibacillus halodenitrificans]|uniref:Diacylglycerol kinase n=1 Tax=Virgibacillus halodenitrificans TaxID=1482 RepID=A0AAC9IZ46_VIRHA|nr:diacylglycerol kinase [Virgibacillus halodenitrificans]APC48227.1 diacylglycerol kinase [Virgibacillus halodenitrificans]MBD1222831.1 diacylglycerol kinase [Virgibacillus halodenitrificans]MCG1029231.1 diacylglycerol kinase [Virgibacillus halodenitrificans]MEC2160062.1 diacylglycerol kinase [Virgibacillus halodenitrificans]MYL60127.1 diacylglycerol kinase [Virgibacillus halodenitrificans]